MSDLASAPITRTITTPQGWKIAFPLPKPRGLRRRLRTVRIDTVKREIGKLLSQGFTVKCPVTGKTIKIYRRGIHRSQVRTLERLRDKTDKLGLTYLALEFFTARRDGDLAKLQAWGLALRLKPESAFEQEKCRGQWRITELGRAWLAGTAKVPRQQAFLLGRPLGPVDATDLITTADVPEHFSREQLDAGDDGKQPGAA